MISGSEVGMVLEQLFSDFENNVPQESFSQIDVLSKSLARSMAIKSGVVMNKTEQQNLVNNLFACKEATVTPSNKPIFVTLTVADIEKKFF